MVKKTKPKTKQPTRRRGATAAQVEALRLADLAARVTELEDDFVSLKADMANLGSDVAALRVAVRQVDERTIRGEHLMLAIQGDQVRAFKVLERIEARLSGGAEPPAPVVVERPREG